VSSNTLQTIAGVDAVSRAIGNVGVPAAIALLILWQITPRLDQQTQSLQALNTAVAVNTARCGGERIADLAPGPFDLVAHG
jgi:hypothetical protein